jgi:antagonist of KipI
LPDGQLVVLMADHQTTGGYPRIAQVTSESLQSLAQLKSNDRFQFVLTDLAEAEQTIAAQHKYLQQLQIACKFKIENYFDVTLRSEL